MEAKKHIFTPMEKKCLVDIIKKYNNIIENRDTDGSTLRTKNEAWDKITQEFNANPLATSQASHKQLRRLWMNLKQRQREALTKERQHRLATGGGPSTSDAFIDPDISMVAPALIVGIDTAIDSDTIQEMKSPVVVTLPEAEPIFMDQAIDITPISVEIIEEPEDRENPTPQTQKSTPPPSTTSQPSSQPSSRPSSRTQMAVHSTKLSVIEKEYKDRQRRANEKHVIEMLILKEQLKEAKAKAELAELILKQKRDLEEETKE